MLRVSICLVLTAIAIPVSAAVEVSVLGPQKYDIFEDCWYVSEELFDANVGPGTLLLDPILGEEDELELEDVRLTLNGEAIELPEEASAALRIAVSLIEHNTLTVEVGEHDPWDDDQECQDDRVTCDEDSEDDDSGDDEDECEDDSEGSFLLSVLQDVEPQVAFRWSNEIFVMNEDGSEVRQLTFNVFEDRDPAISPDGRNVAFATMREGNWEVYAIGIDGSDLRSLTIDLDSPIQIQGVDWHPDGSKLIFSTRRDDPEREFKLYEVEADGSGWRLLFDNTDGFESTFPKYSFDGSRLVIQRLRAFNGFTSEAWTSSADGTALFRVTNTASGSSSALTNRMPSQILLDGREQIVLYRDVTSTRTLQLYVVEENGDDLHNPCPTPTQDWLPSTSANAADQVIFTREVSGGPPEIWKRNLITCSEQRIGVVNGREPDWWVPAS